MQEIWATSYANRLPRKRVAVVLWKFRQVRPGEAATTRWRDLIPPPPRITTNSPAPAILESQMTLDTSINNHMHQPVAIYTDPFHQQSFDSFGDCPDPASNPQNFDEYPTSAAAFSGPSATMDYSMPNIDVKQEDLGSVDFSEGHINLYCEPYSQPPSAYDGRAQFVASEKDIHEGYDDDQWAAMCPHPVFADVGFEHGNALQVADRSEHGLEDFTGVSFEHVNVPQVADRSEHRRGDFTDVGFEHANLPDVPEKLEHDRDEDFTDVGFQDDNIAQVADRPDHDSQGFTDVDFKYVKFAQALQISERGNEHFTDVGFEHSNLGQTAEQPEQDSEHFAVSFEHADLPDVLEKSQHGSEIFTDVGFEHVNLPELPDNAQHDNDSDYEHVQVKDYAMAFD